LFLRPLEWTGWAANGDCRVEIANQTSYFRVVKADLLAVFVLAIVAEADRGMRNYARDQVVRSVPPRDASCDKLVGVRVRFDPSAGRMPPQDSVVTSDSEHDGRRTSAGRRIRIVSFPGANAPGRILEMCGIGGASSSDDRHGSPLAFCPRLRGRRPIAHFHNSSKMVTSESRRLDGLSTIAMGRYPGLSVATGGHSKRYPNMAARMLFDSDRETTGQHPIRRHLAGKPFQDRSSR